MSGSRPVRRRRREAGELGFTLVETLVAMLVFTIFSAMVVEIYASLSNQETTVDTRFTSTGLSQTVMDHLTSELKAAVYCSCGSTPDSPIATATATSITFYAALGGTTGPTEVQFTLSGNKLTETDTPAQAGGQSPNWSFPGPATVTIVSPSVINSTSNPLFTYYNSSGTALSAPLAGPDQTVAVESVGVNLVVETGTSRTASTLDDVVHLSNVDFAAGNG